MLPALAIVFGAVLGFTGSRLLRRPDRAAQAASVARTVGGSLGRRSLTLPELQRACFSEMVRHVRVDRQRRTTAPNRYVLHLHPDDLAAIDENRRWFTQGLVDALHHTAGEQGWHLDGEVRIDCEADPRRHRGVPHALAVAPEAAGDAPPVEAPPATPATDVPATPAPRSFALVRTDTGQQIPLGTEVVTIGRSRDRTVTVDDDRVSRSHARVEPHPSGWAVVDEGSSNGTRVGGTDLRPHEPRVLRAGDVVSVGPVDLRIAAVAATDPAEPATRALDDRTRTRLSSEAFPPAPDGDPR